MNQLELFIIEITARSPHGHNDLEIGMLLDGSVTIYTEKEQYTLAAGDIYIINRYQVHSLLCTEGSNHILAFQINTDLFRTINRKFNHLYVKSNIIHSGVLHNNLKNMMFECAGSYFGEQPYRDLKCAGLLINMMYELLQCAHHIYVSEEETVSAKNNYTRINRITDYISEHYMEPITLGRIAELEKISTYHLSHFIKDMLGISFQEYLNNLRFEHALRLIQSSDLKILDICMETGFSSSRYLNQMFMKKFGCTAKQYINLPEKPAISEHSLPAETIEKRYSFQQSAFFFHTFYANKD